MKHKHVCQSCCMLLDDPKLTGTEQDGSSNADYCIYCYSNGKFTNPEITLEEMTAHVIDKMEQLKADEHVIALAVNSLPHLKRWDGQVHTVHIY